MTIGVNIIGNNVDYQSNYLPEGAWLRLMLWWNKIQPEQDSEIMLPDWSALEKYPKLIQIRCTPDWSRHNKGRICMLPHRDYWKDWVRFTFLVIEKYKPNIIEIFNEPDAHSDQVSKAYAPYIGCVGKSIKAGIKYAVFCNHVAQNIRWRYPNVKVAVGALLHDKSWRFITGMRMAFRPRLADYISYHQYTYGAESAGLTRVLRKGQKLGSLFKKPILLTETSVLTSGGGGGELHENRKADYLRRLRTAINGSCIETAYWFTLNGKWRNCGMMQDINYCPTYDEWLRGFG